LYAGLNRREHVHPDPLEFLYRYGDGPDREVAGLVASSLAYGRVRQILRSVDDALGRLGPAPGRFAAESSPAELSAALAGFRHRFATGGDLVALLSGTGRLLREHGTLGARFCALVRDTDETVVPGLRAFAAELEGGTGTPGHLLPCPDRGSACKRLHLFLRWMVRRDEVDPGGWDGVSAAKLVVPLDTHMHRISLALGLTGRKSADLVTALEITTAFREFSPEDPVKYDFALTRLGMWKGSDLPEPLRRFAGWADSDGRTQRTMRPT
jgi:uncharacterized protein (TIGR02757 family)